MDTLAQTDRKPAPPLFHEGDLVPGPAWLQSLRQKAVGRLHEIEFPSTSQEEWRFTNVAPLLQWPIHAAEPPQLPIGPADIQPFRLPGAYCLVFVNGLFQPALSTLPPKNNQLRAGSLRTQSNGDAPELEKHLARHADSNAHFFTALNTASFQDGAFVLAAANAVVAQPVQLLYLAASSRPGAAVHPRNLIVAAAGSSLHVIETYASLTDAPHLTNAVTELALGPDARVEHASLQNENDNAFHIASIHAVQDANSHWLSHSIATGARLARNQIQTSLNAQGAEAVLNGLYLARGEQLIDHHTLIDHAQPHCQSHEFYYGILAGRSHGVFNGKILVRPNAQKTNAKQTNRNLVLSETAAINTKPQLEIFADDVKCTHGATVGQLSDEALFYLRSRGIGAAMARRMLIRAFAADAVGRVSFAPARERLEKLLTERFEGLDDPAFSHDG